jgi:hypothetical protein
VTDEQLSRLQTWAATLAEHGSGEKQAAGRTIQTLAHRVEVLRQGDSPYWDELDLLEAKRLARQLSTGGGPPARRSAARAITLLVEEHERLSPPRGLVSAWPRPNGRNGNGNGNGNGHGVAARSTLGGNGNGSRGHPETPARREGGSSTALLAPRRMPLPERRGPQRPPPRDPDDGALGHALGGLRPSGGAVRRVVYWLIGAGIVVGTFVYAPRLAAPDIEVAGPSASRLGMGDADVLTFSVTSPAVTNAKWSVDGESLGDKAVEESVKRKGLTSTFTAVALPEGDHTVAVEVPGPIPGATAKHEWSFFVDLTPPAVELAGDSGMANWGNPVTISGTLGEEATVRVGGRLAEIDQGEFAVRFETAPRNPIHVRATDMAGNVTELEARLNIIPRDPPTPVRGVHVTFWAWKHHRAEVMSLVDAGKVTALELDLKDESGIVGFDSGVPLAAKMNAEHPIIDLEEAVRALHAKGVRVVGRLVAFRDPIHAPWAWEHGRRSQVVQTPSGDPYAGYGGFTNFAHPAVRRYNIAIAEAAVAAGVDEILYDYIRRPDGPIESMRFPGLGKTPADRSIADFIRETRVELPTEVFLGASVFGVAATRPEDVAQNIPMMARELDYISPMVYPSHWTPGEYNVPNPNAQPYEIVRASLADFQKQVHGTGARLVPWLQDFTMGYEYGPEEVRAQLEATKSLGIDEFILWNPLVRYHAEALDEQPALQPIED